MPRTVRFTLVLGSVAVLAAIAGGCAGGASTPPGTAAAPTGPTSTVPSPVTATTAGRGSAALTAEAGQTAAGDIPDNQVFLTFRNTAGGYSIKYPEGWARRNTGAKVTFQDKNNLVRVETLSGTRPAPAGAAMDLARLRSRSPSLTFDPPTLTTIGGRKIVKIVYATRSAPNPVTDKRVTLVVDRYYIPGTGRYAIVDLGTPRGVDNVDAYRLMIESFRWT